MTPFSSPARAPVLCDTGKHSWQSYLLLAPRSRRKKWNNEEWNGTSAELVPALPPFLLLLVPSFIHPTCSHTVGNTWIAFVDHGEAREGSPTTATPWFFTLFAKLPPSLPLLLFASLSSFPPHPSPHVALFLLRPHSCRGEARLSCSQGAFIVRSALLSMALGLVCSKYSLSVLFTHVIVVGGAENDSQCMQNNAGVCRSSTRTSTNVTFLLCKLFCRRQTVTKSLQKVYKIALFSIVSCFFFSATHILM